MVENGVDPPVQAEVSHAKTKFTVFRADSDYESSNRSSFSQASFIGNSTVSGASKRDYIEARSGRKDVFFIFLFIIIFLAYWGLGAYGFYLAFTPVKEKKTVFNIIHKTSDLFLQTILSQISSTTLFSGILCIIANLSLCYLPKAIYQISILSGPLVYIALSCGIGYMYGSTFAALCFFILFVIHAIYLIARSKHIKMYRYLMIEAVKVGSTDEKLFIPILIWAGFLILTGFTITSAFGHYKMYLAEYETNGALYAFFFGVVVFGWIWTINTLRNQYRMVVTGLCLNELLREGTLHENPDKLRKKMWKYVSTRLLGQAIHSAFILSLAESFVIMLLYMRHERFSNLVGYLFILLFCQHVVSIIFKQMGLIHNVMFGSSFFDGTFDVYVPFMFYDELCGHVISLILLVTVGTATTVIGKISTVYVNENRSFETGILLALISGYISLITSEIFFDYAKTSVSTHIISYGENPIVLSRTSPIFTESVRVLRISDDSNIMERE